MLFGCHPAAVSLHPSPRFFQLYFFLQCMVFPYFRVCDDSFCVSRDWECHYSLRRPNRPRGHAKRIAGGGGAVGEGKESSVMHMHQIHEMQRRHGRSHLGMPITGLKRCATGQKPHCTLFVLNYCTTKGTPSLVREARCSSTLNALNANVRRSILPIMWILFAPDFRRKKSPKKTAPEKPMTCLYSSIDLASAALITVHGSGMATLGG